MCPSQVIVAACMQWDECNFEMNLAEFKRTGHVTADVPKPCKLMFGIWCLCGGLWHAVVNNSCLKLVWTALACMCTHTQPTHIHTQTHTHTHTHIHTHSHTHTHTHTCIHRYPHLHRQGLPACDRVLWFRDWLTVHHAGACVLLACMLCVYVCARYSRAWCYVSCVYVCACVNMCASCCVCACVCVVCMSVCWTLVSLVYILWRAVLFVFLGAKVRLSSWKF